MRIVATGTGYPPGAAEGGILMRSRNQPESKTLSTLTNLEGSSDGVINTNRLLRREEGIGRLRGLSHCT
jgi:hypothetical protein